jgi:hypothetical protein
MAFNERNAAMKKIWLVVLVLAVFVALTHGCSEMVPGTCYENPEGNAGTGDSFPTTSVAAATGGDFADPEQETQDNSDMPPGCMVPPGPCEKKCLDAYETDAIKCGNIDDPAQRRTCQDAAHEKYKKCREPCEQGAARSCTDMFVACTDKGWPCTRQIDKKKTLCAFCLDDCNDNRPYKYVDCYTCGFR